MLSLLMFMEFFSNLFMKLIVKTMLFTMSVIEMVTILYKVVGHHKGANNTMSFYYFEVGGGGDYDVTLLGLLAIYQKIFCSFLHPTSPTTNIQCHLKHLNQFLKHFQNWVSWDWLLHWELHSVLTNTSINFIKYKFYEIQIWLNAALIVGDVCVLC